MTPFHFNHRNQMSTYSSWWNGLRRQLLHNTKSRDVTEKKQLDQRILLQNQKYGTPKWKSAQIKFEHTYLCKNGKFEWGKDCTLPGIAHCLRLGILLPISFCSMTWQHSITVQWARNVLLDTVWSNSWLRAGSPKADCSGPCPAECWIDTKRDSSTSLGTLFQCLTIFML